MQRAAGTLGCDSVGCVLIYTVSIPAYNVVSGLSKGTSQHFAYGQHQSPPSCLLLQNPGDCRMELGIFITCVLFFNWRLEYIKYIKCTNSKRSVVTFSPMCSSVAIRQINVRHTTSSPEGSLVSLPTQSSLAKGVTAVWSSITMHLCCLLLNFK